MTNTNFATKEYYPFRGVIIEYGENGSYVGTTTYPSEVKIKMDYVGVKGKKNVKIVKDFDPQTGEVQSAYEERYVLYYDVTIGSEDIGRVQVLANHETNRSWRRFNFLFGPLPIVFDDDSDYTDPETIL